MIVINNSYHEMIFLLVSFVIMHLFHMRSKGFFPLNPLFEFFIAIPLKLEYLIMRLANKFVLGEWSWFFRSRIRRFIFELVRHVMLKFKLIEIEPYTIEESIALTKNIFRKYIKSGRKIYIGLRVCPCRLALNKIERDNKDVSNCTDIVFLIKANNLSRYSFLKFISLEECIERLKKFDKEGLVHSFMGPCSSIYGGALMVICNCHKDICVNLIWRKKRNFHFTSKPHNIAQLDPDKCTGCGNCITACPILARKMVNGKAIVLDHCMGCGVCRVNCEANAITMVPTKHKPVYFPEYMIRRADGSFIGDIKELTN